MHSFRRLPVEDKELFFWVGGRCTERVAPRLDHAAMGLPAGQAGLGSPQGNPMTTRANRQSGQKDWLILASDYALGLQLAEDTTRAVLANGGKVLGTIYQPLSISDFPSFLPRAQSSGAQVIALANAGGDTINAIKQAGESSASAWASRSMAAMLLMLTDVHSLGLKAAHSRQFAPADDGRQQHAGRQALGKWLKD